MKIFVYGGTGKVSGEVISNLTKKGVEVVATSRHPDKSKKVPGVHWVRAEVGTTEGLNELAKVDRAFFISPPGYADQYSVLHPWLEKAKEVGLKKVVLMTAMGVGQAPDEAPFRKLELELIASGLKYDIVRPNWFMQNFHTFWIEGIKKDGKIYFPGGDAPVSFIDTSDIASVASTLLFDDLSGREADLTGPRALTHQEVAAIISKASGRHIEYADVTPEQFRSGLLAAGLPADYVDFLVLIAGALKAGYSAPVFNTVKEITGQAPASFEDYAKRNAHHWK